MGGATSLEWPLCFPVKNPPSQNELPQVKSGAKPYVKAIMVLAASARHSAWSIAWCEIQRQTIEADTHFNGGHYLLRDPPKAGLAAARMCALMTYRQPQSFERRFSRMRGKSNLSKASAPAAPENNDSQASSLMEEGDEVDADDMKALAKIKQSQAREQYAVQSYLHHHGTKFLLRFDANCYIHLENKLDAHDVAQGRAAWVKDNTDGSKTLSGVLELLGTSPVAPRVLILSVTSDMLYTPEEQHFLHDAIPRSELAHIESSEGHDGFLLEYPQIKKAMSAFLGHTPDPLSAAL